jgi:hypothetical protein
MDLLSRSRDSVGRQLLVFTLGALSLPVTVLVDALVAFIRQERERRVLAVETVRCSRGHDVELVGGWQCPSCGIVFEGHGFGQCPLDGARAAYVQCACGTSVFNPLFKAQRR